MGSAQGKDISNNAAPMTTPTTPQHSIDYIVSPLKKSMAASVADPRSPGGRRTPIQSPNSTPTLSSRQKRERVLMRIGSASKFGALDPRSPGLRTPLKKSMALSTGLADPRSPMASADPRSPYALRTPLALSAQDAVMADIIVVGEEVPTVSPIESRLDASQDGAEATAAGSSTPSCKASTDAFTPEVSAAILALAVTPLYDSPSLARRRRKDLARASPLKKSYSAPVDENKPPSPLCKPVSNVAKTARAPLSPLTQRAVNSRHCVGVQPIKFRMDPGILG